MVLGKYAAQKDDVGYETKQNPAFNPKEELFPKNQGSLLPKNFFESLKNMFSTGAENVGKGEVYTAQGLGGLGQNLGLPNTKPLLSNYGSIMSDLEAETGDASGIGLNPAQMSQLKVMGGKGATLGTGGGNGGNGGNGVPLGLTKDTYKLEDVGFEISEADSEKKIGQILGTDKDPYNPAFPELSGVPAEGFIPSVIPEVPEVDNNDQYFKDAYANIYAQIDSGNPYITLPDILDADGNIVPYYRNQETQSWEIVGVEKDGTTPRYGNVTRMVKIVDPRYSRLEMIYKNAQTQANWMAKQEQTTLSGERDWMRDIIPFLTEPGVADILGLLGGGGVDPSFQPMFGQGFGQTSAVPNTLQQGGEAGAMSALPSSVQPAMQRQHLPTESYIQRLGPDALEGLQGLMGFMGKTPYDLQRMVGSVTPQFSGIFPGGGGATGQPTGVR